MLGKIILLYRVYKWKRYMLENPPPAPESLSPELEDIEADWSKICMEPNSSYLKKISKRVVECQT